MNVKWEPPGGAGATLHQLGRLPRFGSRPTGGGSPLLYVRPTCRGGRTTAGLVASSEAGEPNGSPSRRCEIKRGRFVCLDSFF